VTRANAKNSPIDLRWEISQDTEFSWKKDVAFGGGLFSYYGVHLFSLLADLGLTVDSFQVTGNDSSLHLESLDPSKQHRFVLEFSKTPSFRVTLENQTWNLTTPFGPIPLAGEIDPRISSIKTYLDDGIESDSSADQIDHEYKILRISQAVEEIL
jgi:predicted dehydrogenase